MSVYEKKEHRFFDYKHEMWSDLAIDTMAFCQEVQTACPGVPCVLVGTKTDLRLDDNLKDDCYTKEEMELFAEIWWIFS